MKPSTFSLGVLAALLPTLSAWWSPGTAEQEGLQRVSPERVSPEEERAEEGPRDSLARPFAPDEWSARLQSDNLDRRGRAFEALVRRAQLEPAARAWIEELAHAPEGGELSWTARLALRELGATPMPRGFPRMLDPMGSQERMGRLLQALMAGEEEGFLLMSPGVTARGTGPGVVAGRIRNVRSVSVEQGQNSAQVHVTERLNGNEVARTYEGSSLEQILLQNPQLGHELGHLRIEIAAGAPLQLHYDLEGGQAASPGHDPALRRLFAGRGVELAPQAISRPTITDRLGVKVRPLSAEDRRALGLGAQGLLVERSFPETFAQLLGVRSGAILLEIDTLVLRDVEDLERAMRERTAEDRLTLLWLDELGQRQQKTWMPPAR